ncbi:MAG: undecaprenyl-diphosphate phosphatase [Solirubrobacteraceae bacterium]
MRRLPLRQAVALGLLQGPTEMLPISSSGHTTLVPWLANWPYTQLDPKLRKSFEVALHAGTAAALLLRSPSGAPKRPTCSTEQAGRSPRLRVKLAFLLPAVIPPALAGYALGGQIERRLGTPTATATGLLAGSVAMLGADLGANSARPAANAGSRDGLLLGLAQALALMPGVSRSGAALTAARLSGFSRRAGDQLSWQAGLPVIAGAALLKGTRLLREGAPEGKAHGLALPFTAGAASAFLSTLASARVLGPERRAALLPACAVYRAALALLVIRRMRDNTI